MEPEDETYILGDIEAFLAALEQGERDIEAVIAALRQRGGTASRP